MYSMFYHLYVSYSQVQQYCIHTQQVFILIIYRQPSMDSALSEHLEVIEPLAETDETMEELQVLFYSIFLNKVF